MSMSTMTEDERREHAKRALDRFRTMISTVYGPALRAITGKPSLKVQPASKISATDGRTVWLMTPWALGETQEHDRALCNKRDSQTLRMLCAACATRDSIDAVVFHESAHITSDSFEEVDPNRYKDLIRQYATFVDADALDLPWWINGRRVYVQALAGKVEPVYLPQIQNVVEDIYVNRRLFKHRPGTEMAMKVRTVEVFERGFHQADGSHHAWVDQKVDAQAVIAVYNLGSRLPWLNDHLAPEVKVVTDDKILQDLMEQIPGEGDAYIRAAIGLQVWARLRELGFCIPPSAKPPEEDDEDPPEGGDESDDQDPGEESDEPSPSGGSGSGSTKGTESSEEDEDAETEGDGGDETSDEESDEGEPSGTTSDGDEEADDDDDSEGSGEGDEDEDDDESSEGSGANDDADEDDDDDESDEDEGDGSGSGSDEADDDDEDEDEDEGDEPGPTPEELDKEEAEELAKLMKQMFGHEDEEQESGDYTEPEDAMKPSPDINGEDEADAVDEAMRWEKFDAPPKGIEDYQPIEIRSDEVNHLPPIDFDPGLITGETARMRAVFTLNRKTRIEGSLKSGSRLDVPHLHRIGQDDFRIFGNRSKPAKRDWFVLVGLDDSGSTTSNGAGRVIREMGLAVGDMLLGCGVKFAMYGHGGEEVNGLTTCVHRVLKDPDEPWNSETRDRLKRIGRNRVSGNMDGHTLEQYRKVIMPRRETDKLLLYFTDGAMPMFNYTEEREILEREIEILRRGRIDLFGVGYQTDSPKEYGMDTIVIEDGRDLPGLIHGLADRLGR